jgi:hypothetical protein
VSAAEYFVKGMSRKCTARAIVRRVQVVLGVLLSTRAKSEHEICNFEDARRAKIESTESIGRTAGTITTSMRSLARLQNARACKLSKQWLNNVFVGG